MSEGDVALACMQVFVDGLVTAGLRHACVSPGSRSTPIALALYRHPRVQTHVHLDERSSAFFALGLAKTTGRPVAIACTSGTAAANFFPAVVEASMSRVPLVVLTADRPPELRGVGANQTIDQVRLFGGYASCIEANVPLEERSAGALWGRMARATYSEALRPAPRPVHVNLPFREPLVPSGEPVDLGRVSRGRGELRRGRRPLPRSDIDRAVAEFGVAERGVIVAGSLRDDARLVIELARGLGWPLIAEPTSGLRLPGALSAAQFLLADEAFTSEHVPDLVLQFGAAPTSRPGLGFVASARELVIVDPDELVADPARHASWRLVADPAKLAQALDAELPVRGETEWLLGWREADGLARRAVDDLVDSWDEPFEGRIARDLAALVPDGATLFAGSSMPVRDLDLYMAPRAGLRVFANRGASGIDGSVSTALGAAASGAPTFALLGDLALLHDVGALVWGAKRGHDAVFVVPNNNGGVIFSFLAQRDLPELEELFTTPHGLDLARLCAAAGVGHLRVERASDLRPAVGRAAGAGGIWVVEVPVDRERNVARHAETHAAVAAVLGVRS